MSDRELENDNAILLQALSDIEDCDAVTGCHGCQQLIMNARAALSSPATEGADDRIKQLGRMLETEIAILRNGLQRISEWDCLNPPRQDLLGDLPWLRRLVDELLQTPSPAASWLSMNPSGIIAKMQEKQGAMEAYTDRLRIVLADILARNEHCNCASGVEDPCVYCRAESILREEDGPVVTQMEIDLLEENQKLRADAAMLAASPEERPTDAE